jgi:hypothetical protein
MSAPINLASRRWDSGDGRPGSHSVRDMLEVALAKLESGELGTVDHAILVWGRETDGVGEDGYFQAGSFNVFAQVGLLERGLTLLKKESD